MQYFFKIIYLLPYDGTFRSFLSDLEGPATAAVLENELQDRISDLKLVAVG